MDVADRILGHKTREFLNDYFTHAAKALDPSESGIVQLQRMFQKPSWMPRLETVAIGPEKHLYTLGGQVTSQESTDSGVYEVTGIVVSLAGLDNPAMRKRKTVRSDAEVKFGKSVIAQFADQASYSLDQIAPGGWRTIYLELAKDLVRRQRIDSVVRLNLILLFLEWHTEEAWPTSAQPAELLQFTENVTRAKFGRWQLNDVPWPHAASGYVKLANEKAHQFIEELPDLDSWIEESNLAYDKLRRQARSLHPVGMIWVDGDKANVSGRLPDGEIGVIRNGESGRVVFEPYGRSAAAARPAPHASSSSRSTHTSSPTRRPNRT